MSVVGKRTPVGRPEVTSHAAIEQAAFRLFARHGFDDTSMAAIATEVGVSRRTLFRYYASKNDIPWGQFDATLNSFEAILAAMPRDIPLHVAIHRGVLAFNDFPADAQPSHRERMQLILWTPTLQAHSVLRYAQWRAVIAEYVAKRRNLHPTHLLPVTVGHVSLALALASYESWLITPHASLPTLLDDAMGNLKDYVRT